jgi:hypothetical protein
MKPIIEVQEINAGSGMREFDRMRLLILQLIFDDELPERIALQKNGLKTAYIRSDRPSEVRSPAMAAWLAHWMGKHVCAKGQSPERFAVMFALGRRGNIFCANCMLRQRLSPRRALCRNRAFHCEMEQTKQNLLVDISTKKRQTQHKRPSHRQLTVTPPTAKTVQTKQRLSGFKLFGGSEGAQTVTESANMNRNSLCRL